ncbi:MAG: O-methyltransferase [Bacteroidales bacterium]|jgi:predicted O-methyltransferase YrrM|nr:O-methyltransferase [Bacteroidales bacterium]
MERQIEEFITSYSSPQDPLLEDLFRQTHIKFVNPNMVSGHLQGKLLEFIALMIKPETILEIGTYTGYSAICLARGLRPGGKLYTIESNDELDDFARNYFIRAGLEEKIVKLTGRAQDLIPTLNMDFDLVFIDGDKREYSEYFMSVIGKVKPGGFIIADNVLWGNKVLETDTSDRQTRGILEFNSMILGRNDIEKVILPLRDGLMLIRKL